MDIWSENISMRPDEPNSLTWKPATANEIPRYPLQGSVICNYSTDSKPHLPMTTLLHLKFKMKMNSKYYHCCGLYCKASSNFYNDESSVIGTSIFMSHKFNDSTHTSWFNPHFLIRLPFTDPTPIVRFEWIHVRVSLKKFKYWNHSIFKILEAANDFGGGYSKFLKTGRIDYWY